MSYFIQWLGLCISFDKTRVGYILGETREHFHWLCGQQNAKNGLWLMMPPSAFVFR
jgi:hypothetical protein